jgi:ABC-type nitrate/sulfonate/bicarbonate transport system substrate-binding protein
MKRLALLLLFLAASLALPVPRATAEEVRIGTIKVAGAGAMFLAEARGYFAAEGLTPRFVFFEAAQPIAVANVSGDIDFGATPPGGGRAGRSQDHRRLHHGLAELSGEWRGGLARRL